MANVFNSAGLPLYSFDLAKTVNARDVVTIKPGAITISDGTAVPWSGATWSNNIFTTTTATTSGGSYTFNTFPDEDPCPEGIDPEDWAYENYRDGYYNAMDHEDGICDCWDFEDEE